VSPRADVLMVTYRSAGYLDLSLCRLLATCGDRDRVWLWHNGDDEATLEALSPYLADPRVHRFHHSRENVRLREPTNWLWESSDAQYVSKVDDDCLVTPGWLDTFDAAHRDNSNFGVIGSWRHPAADFQQHLAARKIQEFEQGHILLRNLWVQGSGYLLPRDKVRSAGQLRPDESFSGYCVRLARRGAINGFYFPFVPEDHMDDPRSPNTLITDDESLARRMPLSAAANGVRSVEQWTAQLQRSAMVLQTASLNPRHYVGWRRRARLARQRLSGIAGRPRQW
jgi:glycosyltransferase involved in cell wall biosynthesis